MGEMMESPKIAREGEGDLSFEDVSKAFGCLTAKEVAELNKQVVDEHGLCEAKQHSGYVLYWHIKFLIRKIKAIYGDISVVDDHWKMLGSEVLIINKAKTKIIRATKTISFDRDVYDILVNTPGATSRFVNKAVKKYIANTTFEEAILKLPKVKTKKYAQSVSLPIETIKSVLEFAHGVPIENFIYSEAVRTYQKESK